MTTVLKDRFVSIEHYFALDSETAPERWEWRNGDVRCMSGAQPEHNIICLNVGAELRARLRGSGCQTFPSDQRVKVHAGSPYLSCIRMSPPPLIPAMSTSTACAPC